MPSELPFLQAKVHTWRERNFPDADDTQQLLGIAEECGELSHAHLKAMQRIRGSQAEHDAAARDAIGDLAIYMMGYCSYRGWDLMEIIQETADHVLKRDWIADPVGGNESVTAPVAEQVDELIGEPTDFYCAMEHKAGPGSSRCVRECEHCKVIRERDKHGVDLSSI